MRKAFFASVHGRVQGVGFRYSCKIQADKLGITGWVRNMPDGSVELYAEGDETALSSFREWLYRGPSFARVDRVIASYCEPEGCFDEFYVRFL
ncbi:acylphosphatase [Spirochaetia bacterium 38H-sp]|uniref:Acylphosphatase n=1 Tax=Rarispira pelagica TaxID=3141764 RepID=A0ABU9UA58_9SPIR